jgi:deoxyribodipyrimidine photo-lyase
VDATDPRIRRENDAPVRPAREYVLYWMTAARRTRWNRALAHALEVARSVGRPLLVLDALRSRDRYATARSHRFRLDGMADLATALQAAGIAYYPYVEPIPDAGQDLPFALAERACAVVTDAPLQRDDRRAAEVAARADVRFDTVDGTGLLPRALAPQSPVPLDDFRLRLRRALPAVVLKDAVPESLSAPARRMERLPKEVADRWHPTRKALLDGDPALLARIGVNHAVGPSERRGGERAARAAWAEAVAGLRQGLEPDVDAWLLAGHLSVEEVAQELLLAAGCIPSVDLRPGVDGPGWWRVPPAADRFLERIVLRREHTLASTTRHDRLPRYDALPPGARRALETAAADPARPRVDLATLEAARGPDAAWNAVQQRLTESGVLPPAARAAWVRGLLAVAPSPRDAFDLAHHLTALHVLGGRDPFTVAETTSAFLDAAGPPGGEPSRRGDRPRAGRRPRGPRAPDRGRRPA